MYDHIQIDEAFKRRLLRKLKISVYESNIGVNLNAIWYNLYRIERKLDDYLNRRNE